MATERVVRIEYEIPPTRAIHEQWLHDDGYSEGDVAYAFRENNPLAKIRKIEFMEKEVQRENE